MQKRFSPDLAGDAATPVGSTTDSPCSNYVSSLQLRLPPMEASSSTYVTTFDPDGRTTTRAGSTIAPASSIAGARLQHQLAAFVAPSAGL
jgi:hypothetical protein